MRARLATQGENKLSNAKPPSTIKPPAPSTQLALQPSASVDGAKLSPPALALNKPAPLIKPLSLTHDQAPEAFLELGFPKEAWPVLTKVLYPDAGSLHSVVTVAQYCKARKLDPMSKVFYIININGKDSIWPGIALYRVTAHRTGLYAGLDAPVWGPMKETRWKVSMPDWVRMTGYRLLNGEKIAFTTELYLEEQAVTKKGGELNEMWQESPRQQAMKGLEGKLLRMMFPEEIGTLPTFEEMEGREDTITAHASEFVPPPPPPAIEERNETLLTIMAKKAEAQTTEAPKPEAASSGNQSATTAPPEPASAASTEADTSATQSENTTASQDASATTGQTVDAIPVEVDEDMFDQLFTSGASNGWSDDQIIEEIGKQFNVAPQDINKKQWATMVDLVLSRKPQT